MLVALQNWMASLGVPSRLSVRWDKPFVHRSRFGLWGVMWHRRRVCLPAGSAFRWVPEAIKSRAGLVSRQEVDIFLDASGFGYGEPWPLEKSIKKIGDVLEMVESTRKKLVFLPQSFGRFTTEPYSSLLLRMVRASELVFARERESLEAIVSILGQCNNVEVAPDFTISVKPKPFAAMESIRGRVGIIPNSKMYTMRKDLTRKKYLRGLLDIIKVMEAGGEKVILILHGDEPDQRLCEEIVAASPSEIDIFASVDPCEIKMAIGLCKGVISSRYHGFASALYQGIPSVATTWSHKYQALGEQFGVPDAVLETYDPKEICDKLSEIIARPNVVKMLRRKAAKAQEETVAMWKKIEALIPH